jgi:hypothetical protein
MADKYDNIDSPFHRAIESDRDRKIKTVKDQFVGVLTPLLLEDVRIKAAELTHTPLSIYISFSIITKHSQTSSSREIRLWYDMDKHEFREPRCWVAGVQIGDGNMLYSEESLQNIVLGIMTKCFFVSQMPGLGSSQGGDWCNSSDSLLNIAKNEWDRLIYLTNERLEKEQKMREDKEKRDAEFLRSIRSGFY